MNSRFFEFLIFCFLFYFQIAILENLQIMNGYIAYGYLYIIIVFDKKNSIWLQFLMAYFIGQIVDIAEMTGGVHAGASVLLVLVKELLYKFPIVNMYKDDVYLKISTRHLKIHNYLLLSFILIFSHHLYFMLFTQNGFWQSISSAFFNCLYTLLVVLILDLIFRKPKIKEIF